MGYVQALMGYGMLCEVAFRRACLEEAALRGWAGLRVGSDFGPGRMGRVGVGPGSGPAGSGRSKLRLGARNRAGLLQAGSGRAFAIRKRINTDSGVCEINADLIEVL